MAEVAFPRQRRWEDLGRDLLVILFSNLGAAELFAASSVCSSWRDASSEPSLWRTLDFRHWNRAAPPRRRLASPADFAALLRSAVARSRGAVRHIALPDQADAADLCFVAQSCPDLRYLHMNSGGVTEIDRHSEFRKFHLLQGLAIPRHAITIKFLRKFSFSCPNVQELKVHPGDAAVDTHAATLIGMYFPLLEKLELNNCRVTRSALTCFLDKLQHLEHLDISGYGRVAVSASVLERASCLKAFIWDCEVDEGEFGNHVDSDGSEYDESGPDFDIQFMEWLAENLEENI